MSGLLKRVCCLCLTLALTIGLSSVGAYAAIPWDTQIFKASGNAPWQILITFISGSDTVQATNAELYEAAVIDSMTIEDEEILPLIEISDNSPMCTWDEDGRVLMLTHHSYPDSYIAGEKYILTYGEVWTFTDKEIIGWYKESKNGVTDWPLRFKQLIGLPEGREYTHFSAMWVNPVDITRPAYEWELTDAIGADDFTQEPSEEYKAWFDSNIVWSYFDSAYPWTRLGYTYDWAAGSDEYGLSEFIVRKDAVTDVEFTMTTVEFITWLESQ